MPRPESSTTVRQREGSPWKGLWAVVSKEMADHLTSVRMRILEILVVLTAAGTVYSSLKNIRETVGEDRFLFLRLFTTSNDPLPAFASMLAFLIPLISIALAFDSINGEFARRTMSRILAQPIYRDGLLFGKFLASLFTLALVLTAIWLLIYGLGIIGLGLPPNGEEVLRSFWFLLSAIVYGTIWIALAMLFSIIFRQSATAALASIAVWLFFTVFWDIIASVAASSLRPVQYGLAQEILDQARMQMFLSRLSPNTLFAETMIGMLNPTVRSLGLLLSSQMEGAIMGSALPLGQSLLLIWPQLTGMIAVAILLFVMGYTEFQRQEIRA